MNIPRSYGRKRARIEIVPLIDIVFFLLATFVMVSMSMVQNQGVAVNLPKAATGTAEDRNAAVTISVKEDGTVFYNKENITIAEVQGRLKQLASNNPNAKVFINADEKALFSNAVTVLDEARKAGVTKVAIQTRGAGEK